MRVYRLMSLVTATVINDRIEQLLAVKGVSPQSPRPLTQAQHGSDDLPVLTRDESLPGRRPASRDSKSNY